MASNDSQVKALQEAIVERATVLANEHVHQGNMTRNKIMEDIREKIKLMEQKELLSAKVHADREYQRLVQASELRIHAELDRNRWGLVQSVMNNVVQSLDELHKNKDAYKSIFRTLLSRGTSAMACHKITAFINSEDLAEFGDNWDEIIRECCDEGVVVTLSHQACSCSGGLKLMSSDEDVMVDYTFEGIIERRDAELQLLIFERLFSTVSAVGDMFNG